MARGHRDWLHITPTAFNQDSDTNELLARLGHAYSYIRTGKVIWNTGFNSHVNDLDFTVSGANTSYLIDSENVLFGDSALHLIADTANTSDVVIAKNLPSFEFNTLGVQFAVMYTTENNLSITVSYEQRSAREAGRTNSDIVSFDVKVTPRDKKIVVVIDGTPQTIDFFGLSAPLPAIVNFWIIYKFVFNVADRRLDHVRIGNSIIPVNLQQVASTTTTIESFTVRSQFKLNDLTDDSDMWIDNFIITTDEPLLFNV